MTFRHIEAFRAVVATGSMTEASRRLHTSQPQVSRLIAQLEAITGLPLFDRSGSRVVPSLDGTRFHAEVERAFVGLTSLESAAARIRAFGAERLRVAAMPRLAGGLLARAVVRFRAAHPDVIVAIHSGDDETVNHWLATGFCDAALTMLYGDGPDAHREHVETRACVAVLPQDHPLAAQALLTPADFRRTLRRLLARERPAQPDRGDLRSGRDYPDHHRRGRPRCIDLHPRLGRARGQRDEPAGRLRGGEDLADRDPSLRPRPPGAFRPAVPARPCPWTADAGFRRLRAGGAA